MKQWNFKMNKLCSKTLKILINELSRPVHELETSQKNAICIMVININKIEILLCLIW